MKSLTVLYDGQCPLCDRSRCWLQRQPKRLAMTMLAQQSAEAQHRFGHLMPDGPARELIAVADDGRVWRNDAAWIVCLWALRDYRRLSCTFASRWVRPLASRGYRFISSRRRRLS